jgi:exopolysaccharide production protein ExoY
VPAEVPIAFWLRAVYAGERVIAALALLVLLPLTLLIAAIIAALSRRGPLVSHTRVGWRGLPLPMLKFRTMWDGSTAPGPLLEIEDVSGTVPLFKAADTRVRSRFASFCRRYSLDELPQLLHVVRGEMSLVGPRPITRAELELHYEDCIEEVTSLRPGLTGLWQVTGRSELTYAQRKNLDLRLVREVSPRLYLNILLRSIPRVLSGRGSY